MMDWLHDRRQIPVLTTRPVQMPPDRRRQDDCAGRPVLTKLKFNRIYRPGPLPVIIDTFRMRYFFSELKNGPATALSQQLSCLLMLGASLLARHKSSQSSLRHLLPSSLCTRTSPAGFR